MDCVGELKALLRKRQSIYDRAAVFYVNVFQAEKTGERLADLIFVELVEATENPGCFQYYCFCDPNWSGSEKGARDSGLGRIVVS